MANLVGEYTFKIDHRADLKAEIEREREWLEALKQELRAKSEGELVGEQLLWQRADGYARYIIVCERPLELAHLHIGDGYQVEPELIRGLRLQDAQRMVQRQRRIDAFFCRD